MPASPASPASPVLLGVLGDTHGKADACAAAVELLRRRGATHFCHTGDVGDAGVLDRLAGTACRLVWGNTDLDRDQLDLYARDLDLEPMGDWGRFDLAGFRIVLTHGDDTRGLARLRDDAEARRERVDLLLTGHSHVPHDRDLPGGGRWLNPGALHRARPKTCRLVTLDTDGVSSDLLVVSNA